MIWLASGGLALGVVDPSPWGVLCAGALVLQSAQLVGAAQQEVKSEWTKRDLSGPDLEKVERYEEDDRRRLRDRWIADHDNVSEMATATDALVAASARQIGRCDPGLTGPVEPSAVSEAEQVVITLDQPQDGGTGRLWVRALPRSLYDLVVQRHQERLDLAPLLAAARQPEALASLDKLGARYSTPPSQLLKQSPAELAFDMLCALEGQADVMRLLERGAAFPVVNLGGS